ncbi:RluA family pseudouridine synthase [Desulfosudis oleivorans]|uniref:RluA family pseudouridine synthase n=1 Tax=Desulfosudis oleivorans TaxID=181663 RepID=UPI00059E06A0|nr:RluA family pseudouridine synthase [Desulfosudis oleivorans]
MTSAGHDGLRLDTLVAGQWDCSRHSAALLIKNGTILVDGRPQKPSYKVGVNQSITGRIPSQKPEKPGPEPAPLPLLFEDAFLLVVNKPPGLVVHPAPGHEGGTLVNRLLHHFPAIGTVGEPDRPGIVHRLDRNTSGALVVAKTAAAHQALSDMFKSRQVRKTYLALVYGQMKSTGGVVTLPIGRHSLERKKMSVSSPQARPAETRWKVRKAFVDASLLELEIHTGRTHQIRVHCTALQRPVVGDPTYPCKWTRKRQHFSSRASFELLNAAGRQMLHAWRLEFDHPVTGAPMCFTAPLFEDIKEMLHLLRAIDGTTAPKRA